ncbi:MAG: endolytic transglycosylase MltG, partial [Armatimonadetes bacterium]|nr:endolytic transglycosylase MltG [Armatimonadota bacterium]
MLALVAAAIVGGLLFAALKPVVEARTPTQYFRVKDGEGVRQVLERAEAQGLLNSSAAVRLMNRLSEQPGTIRAGTYELSPSMTGQELLGALLRAAPVRQDVLIREGLSAIETARILANKRVADKKAFLELCRDPKQLSHLPNFVIARKGLEGYLFPDTHNLPPLLGARDAAEQLLSTFEQKVYKPLGSPTPQK